MHARDKKKLFSAMQVFLLHFCNVIARQIATRLAHCSGFSHWAVDVERRAMKVNR
jgi:hypothetical protein